MPAKKEKTPKEIYGDKDMPVAANFECSDLGLTMFIRPKEEEVLVSGQSRHIPGTGFKIKFKGGHLTVQNKALLQVVMESNEFKRGMIFPDRTDDTGFWRANGVIKTQVRTVEVAESTTQPTFEGLKFAKAEEPAKPIDQVAVA